MVSCFRFTWVLIPLLLSIATIILGSLAIAGSTKNSAPVNEIYMFKLDLSNINFNAVFNNTAATGAVSDQLSQLGLSTIYSFGLWGYCRGSKAGDNYQVEYCSEPKAMYMFDPLNLLNQQIKDHTDQSLQLPSEVQNYISTAKTVVKVIFITAIVGVALSALTLLLTIFSICSKVLSFFSMVIAILAGISLAIAAAASTGSFSIISNQFEDAVNEFGIKGNLGNKRFYALIWAAVGAALIAALFNLFAICCGRTKSKSSRFPDSDEENVPMMVFNEKR